MSKIEFPIVVKRFIAQKPYSMYKCGGMAKVRPCGEEYRNKTYLGFFLGEITTGIYALYNKETQELTASCHGNPAIFVPELNKIIFGYESWWSRIESEEELREITDADIQNTWYVKALKDMEREEEA